MQDYASQIFELWTPTIFQYLARSLGLISQAGVYRVDGTSQWQTSISPVGALGLEHVGTAADLRSTEHSKIYEDSRKHQIVYDVYGNRNHWFLHPYPFKHGIWGGGVVLKFHFKIPFLQSCFLNDHYSMSLASRWKLNTCAYIAPEELSTCQTEAAHV